MIVLIIIMTWKAQIKNFFNLFTAPWTVLNMYIHSSGQGAVMCKSRATHRVPITHDMSCAGWYEGTAQLLVWQILHCIYFSFICWLKPLTNETTQVYFPLCAPSVHVPPNTKHYSVYQRCPEKIVPTVALLLHFITKCLYISYCHHRS